MDTHNAQPAIRATGLRKSFGDQVVLDGIALDVAEGTIYALLGPNGSGKTGGLRAGGDPLDRLHGGLVGERDGELARRGGVIRRRLVRSLHVWLRRTQLVAGELGLRRGEPELGRALGQDLVQGSQPGGYRLQVRDAELALAKAAGLGAERVVVAVDDYLRTGGQRPTRRGAARARLPPPSSPP